MRCAWKELLAILPPGLRKEADSVGKESMEEIRLRINAPPEMVLPGGSRWLSGTVTMEDLNYVINGATKYSPWTAASAAKGYITAPGGHRIGLCGEVVCKNGSVESIRTVHSLCIRVARDLSGIASSAGNLKGSVLILGAPGTGKTTLLRDLIRQISQKAPICVVDERCELFPKGFDRGLSTDVLTGCPKTMGIDMLLRTMGPAYIALDEITAEEDSLALIQAAYCGVHLLATAHAGSVDDFYRRSAYRPLREHQIFQTVLLLKHDKTYTVERMRT